MENNLALAEFKQGIKLLRKGHSAAGYKCLQHAVELEKEFPYYLSLTDAVRHPAPGKVGRSRRTLLADDKLK